MKKIAIYMKDTNFANILAKSLNSKYKDLSCFLINELVAIDNVEEEVLILTDSDIKRNRWYINLALDNHRYKGIEHIYELICDSIEKNKKDKRIIVFANMSQILSRNKGALDISKELTKKGSTLLVNFNHFHNYDFCENEIGLESLLFLNDDNKLEFNTYEELNYLNSSYLPLQMLKKDNYQKILDKIESSEFNFILIDLCFNLSERDLDILSISNQIIFYNSKIYDNKLINKTMAMINSKENITNNKIFVQEENKSYRVITNNEVKSISELTDLVGLIW